MMKSGSHAVTSNENGRPSPHKCCSNQYRQPESLYGVCEIGQTLNSFKGGNRPEISNFGQHKGIVFHQDIARPHTERY